MVKEMKPFIPEVIIWGYIIALFQQQKAATWKKDINKEGRTRPTTAENLGFNTRKHVLARTCVQRRNRLS